MRDMMTKNKQDHRYLTCCFLCGGFKWCAREHRWMIGPGTGRIEPICRQCWPYRPKDFVEKMGARGPTSDITPRTFVRFEGAPSVTASECGLNAFGSVVACYNDGSRTSVICGHGGSEWLCLDCAKRAAG